MGRNTSHKVSHSSIGIWNLNFIGISPKCWNLEFNLLEFENWNFPKCWNLEFGIPAKCWNLEFENWNLEFEIWNFFFKKDLQQGWERYPFPFFFKKEKI